MSRRITFLVVLLIALTPCASKSAWANVRLPAVFSDHMVLQQQQPIHVWGWAEPGESITVTLGGEQCDTAANDDGKWQVTLGALDARQSPGPYELSVKGQNTVSISDILMGEVWVCSGQSNMQWSVRQSDNSQAEIDAADYPQIRLFTVTRTIEREPVDDCRGHWSRCTPETVEHFSAVGYYFGRHLHRELSVPVGLISTNWGGTQADSWTPHSGLTDDEDFQPILERAANFDPKNSNQASVLFNGMINPLIPFGIRGAIWYQGESNVGRAQQYRKLFPTMISQWRQHWNQGDFPFYYVQLAPYRYGQTDPRACAELWEAQLKTLSLPNTGMAVTTDIGNTKDIHPKNKQDVGLRLALWALAKTYHKDVVFSGPLYDSMHVEDGSIRVKFNHLGRGLASRDGNPLTNFSIAGSDEQFFEATATIDGETIVVRSEKVPRPLAVRFAWRDDAEPNLMNEDGLPASPFRTDDFKMVTDGQK